jgi:uncharacterized protein YhaN
MVIRELYVKNFGKLSEKHFYFRDGVQVISGENEFGKTTLHAFVKAMLFGLERGRGRAAAKDDFTKYEPRSGGRYAGVMRFDCGGRHFRLERTFGTGVKNSKSAALICEDDGEELSVEHGDLEMLLGGLTAELFDSTVSVGQLKSRPGEALSDALENYAANYYETGGTELDLSGAVQILREKRKKTDRFIREEADKEERKIQKMLQECEYLEQDMDEIQREYEERKQEWELLEKTIKNQEKEKESDFNKRSDEGTKESRSKYFIAAGLGGLFTGAAGLLWSRFMAEQSAVPSAPFAWIGVFAFVIGVCALAAGGYEAGKKSGKRKKEDPRDVPYNNSDKDDERKKKQKQQLEWQMEHLRLEWKEKELRCQNVREQCGDVKESDAGKRLREQREALVMAEEILVRTAKETSDVISHKINARASEIFSEITDGKYRSVNIQKGAGISAWNGMDRISVDRLSEGTLEQIYFSIRMAASEMLLGEPMPVILDDAFAFYDDKRLESVIKWLSRQKKQVIILSCHSREAKLLEHLV